jgi:hypothetical protein
MVLRKIQKLVRTVLPVFVVAGVLANTAFTSVSALNLSSRSIVIATSAAGATTTHTIHFTISTTNILGSIQLQFCTNDPFIGSPCTAPAGLSYSGAALSAQTGETGFSVDGSSTANNEVLTRPAAVANAGVPVTFTFTGVINPSTTNQTTYLRISTYASTDASGPRVDQGGAAFNTAGSFGTAAFVPPFLSFCVGVTVNNNCSAFTGNSVSFGTLSKSQVSAISTQFAAATNDPTGYIIYSLGTTLTSGNNVIAAPSTPSPSAPGNSQFGINLRQNILPSVGQNPQGAGTGAPLTDYNAANLFMFNPGAAIASASTATDYTVFTTTYIANIVDGQAPGVYTTTITYMAVAQF